jgi:antitoxin ParD1/3/4
MQGKAGAGPDNKYCCFLWLRVRCLEGLFRVYKGDALGMNVSLTPELEQYVSGKVRSGLYHSASEVIREGLRLLKEKDEIYQRKLEDLRREIQIGIDQADRGEISTFDEGIVEEIKAQGRKRLAAERRSKRS